MTFRPGISGNPSGRPKGASGLAKYVRARTNGGRELVDLLLELARNPKAHPRERAAAAQHLLDRAIGRSQQTATLAVTMSQESALSYPLGWESMPPGEQEAWLYATRPALLSSAGDDGDECDADAAPYEHREIDEENAIDV